MNSYVDLIERFQLPLASLNSEDDKKRRNPHLAFPSLNKCNVVRATAAAIARGKRNLEGVLPSQHSTEIPGRSSGAVVLSVSPSFYLGRCKSPLGNYSNRSHERLRGTPLRLPAAQGFAKAVRSVGGPSQTCSRFRCAEAGGRRPQGDGYRGQWR